MTRSPPITAHLDPGVGHDVGQVDAARAPQPEDGELHARRGGGLRERHVVRVLAVLVVRLVVAPRAVVRVRRLANKLCCGHP